ncbi:hypothetical protein ACR820_02920 [Streptomyces netropsis]
MRTHGEGPAPDDGREYRNPVALPPVARTSLWALHYRASAARRNPPLLSDPVAVELVDRCAWPLET